MTAVLGPDLELPDPGPQPPERRPRDRRPRDRHHRDRHHRDRRRRTVVAVIVCLLVTAAGLGLLVRTVNDRPEQTSATADVIEAGPGPVSPAPGSAGAAGRSPITPAAAPGDSGAGAGTAVTEGAAGLAGPRAPSAGSAAAPGSIATGNTRTASGAPASARPSFSALSGAGVGMSSPLTDVLQDQGVSVPLPDGRSLWIFADTTQLSRAPSFFVTSSGAVSPRGSKQLTYAATSTKAPVEFLPRTAAEKSGTVNGQRYTAIWPTGATMLPDGRILISYAKYAVTVSPPAYTLLSAGLYSFRYPGVSRFRAGAHATRIADGLWSAPDGAIGSPVSAGGYVYFTRCAQLQCLSLRTTPAAVTSKSSYRWWTGSGWSADRSAAVPMAYGANTPGLNPSTAYLPDYGVYATASTSVGNVSHTGLLWVAPTPWGPWSSPASFTLPGCPTAGCYGLHLHPSESTGGRVRISYATSGTGPYVKVTDLAVTIGAGARSVRAG